MLKFPRIPLLLVFLVSLANLSTLGAQGPTRFVENRGQWPSQVRFRRRVGPATAWFLDRSLVLDLVRGQESDEGGNEGDLEGLTMALHFERASSKLGPTGQKLLPGREHFFLGQDRKRWTRNVRGYAEILYEDLYPGVTFRFRESEEVRGIVEYDLCLSPGADLSAVVLRCDGVESLSLDGSGNLLMETERGTLRQKAPLTWQDLPDGGRELVTCRFRLLEGQRYGFEVDGWNVKLPLTIDPGLVYGSFWGAGGNDAIQDLFVDAKGRVLLVGRTSSLDFPETKGAWSKKSSFKATKLWDGFVTCFSADFNTLVFSTYIGGSDAVELNAVFSNAKQEILVGGSSFAMDYPVSKNALQSKRSGKSVFVPYNSDLVLTKLSKDGSTLLYSTYLGGLGLEETSDVHLDDAGIASLVGSAEKGFPTTIGVFQSSAPGKAGLAQPLALRLDTVGGRLRYATYVGGSRYGHARALIVDGKGQLELVGETRSQDFPVTAGALKTRSIGKSGDDKLEGFFARLSPKGDKLLLSTRIGGSDRDSVAGLIHEKSGNLLLYGWSASRDLPTHKGAYREGFAGFGTGPVSYRGDGFVLRLDSLASKVLAGTYLGGSEDDEIAVAALDVWGQLWVMGATGSADLPAMKGSFKGTYESPGFRTWNGEVFFARLDDRLENLEHLSYYGGSDTEEVHGLWVDPLTQEILFAGTTRSGAIPLSKNRYQSQKWNRYAGFIARIAPGLASQRYSGKSSPCSSLISLEPLGLAFEKSKDFDVRVLGAPASSSGVLFMSFVLSSKPVSLPAPLGIEWYFEMVKPNILLPYLLTSDARGQAKVRIDLSFLDKTKIPSFYLHALFAQKPGACSQNKNLLSSTRLLHVDLQDAISK